MATREQRAVDFYLGLNHVIDAYRCERGCVDLVERDNEIVGVVAGFRLELEPDRT